MSKKVLILEGGFNEEHEISLSTASEVKKSLKSLGYYYDSLLVEPHTFSKQIRNYNTFDIFFNSLHGPFGEDGSIQLILEKNKLKYTHSGPKSSKIAFDKNLTKLTMIGTEVIFPISEVINKDQLNEDLFLNFYKEHGSFVLKPVSSGSSFGVRIFNDIGDIEKFFINSKNEKKLYQKHTNLMMEVFINGRELTVGVIEENGISKSIEVTEIITKNNFFDYKAKYSKGLSQHILPAKIDKEIYNECLRLAKIVHDKLECKGLSRSDFIYDSDKDILFFLEINTQPGLTPISLVPEQLNFNKINFDSLIKKLIDNV